MASRDVVRAVVGIGLGGVIGLVGTAMVTNFRGVTEWHARQSIVGVRWLEKVPPWRWLRIDVEDRVRRQVMMERLGGAMFAVAGAAVVVVCAVWLVRLVL